MSIAKTSQTISCVFFPLTWLGSTVIRCVEWLGLALTSDGHGSFMVLGSPEMGVGYWSLTFSFQVALKIKKALSKATQVIFWNAQLMFKIEAFCVDILYSIGIGLNTNNFYYVL